MYKLNNVGKQVQKKKIDEKEKEKAKEKGGRERT